MPKTLPPGTVDIAGSRFRLNVVPDLFDKRDLEYRPRLQPLPPVVDVRAGERFVMLQEGSSCVGHAMAAMVNNVLAAGPDPIRVSPYMLYRLARRYDEFEGDDDAGSSLRGALKGWYYHGVLPTEDWPSLEPESEPDLEPGSRLAERALQHPLGAFYRVNAFRLDDMQSAITELNGMVASAQIHTGWERPRRMTKGGRRMYVIERRRNARPLGGHAFTLVGYNEVGFLVQNSWGEEWGSGGFATLPYDDWLASAYDAWVARPGVPSIITTRQRTKIVSTTKGSLGTGAGPDLARLAFHVVNLRNDGLLSRSGRFVSSPGQIDRIFTHMGEHHERWRDAALAQGRQAPPRRVVLFAHGGLNDEGTGLAIAQKHLNWWLNNQVYPITFAWQSGVGETLLNELGDMLQDKLPFGTLGFDLVEQADRYVEKFARSHVRWAWDEMKENARAASRPLTGAVDWRADGGAPRAAATAPGASLTVDRLRHYVDSTPRGESVEVHLVGHSAGSIFVTAMLPRLQAEGIEVASLSYLAAAISVDEFGRAVLPSLRDGRVRRFVSFGLSDQRELDDVCAAGDVEYYQKSLLYLVSRALERGPAGSGQTDIPLLGMQRYASAALNGSTVADVLAGLGAEMIWAPADGPATSRSSSKSHGGFDDDAPTMTSLLLRILGSDAASDRSQYRPHAALLMPDERPALPPAAAAEEPRPARVADVAPAGATPVTTMEAAAPEAVAAAADSEESSPIREEMLLRGWEPDAT